MHHHYKLFLASLVLLSLVAPYAMAGTTISVLTDREDALYHVGDEVTFRISVATDDTSVTTGDVSYSLTIDGWKEVGAGTLPLSDDGATVSAKFDQPGFLRCTVTHVDPTGAKSHGFGAAGFDPLQIKPSLPVPDDFDDFWAKQKAEIAALSMDPTLTPVDSSVDGINCFDLQLDCPGGAPVSGYYCLPEGAAPKSLPALLVVHGAGVRSSILRPDTAKEGLLVLDINAHGIPNGKRKDFYDDLSSGDLKDYRHRGREDRETYYFLGMYNRLMRAMNFLTSRPEWDGKVLIVEGTSQGGGQSLVAAGLDSRVTLLCAGVPAMCDHTGDVNGWPRVVPRDDNGTPDPKIQEVARYFDAMNFATRTKADALVSVGFIDDVCRPTSIYATYNNLAGKKQILNKPQMNHAVAPEWNEMVLGLIREHIASK